MDITVIGYIAGSLTTISFFPQLIKIFRNKKADEISFAMYSVITLGMILWIVYGLYLKSVPIIVANTISTMATIMIMILTIIYHQGKINDRSQKAQ